MNRVNQRGTAPYPRQAAFALKELVAAIAVLALLFCVRLSAMIGSNNQTRMAQCAANLKQLTSASIDLANDNNGNLPALADGNWVWDAQISTVTALGNYGAGRPAFYCPACSQQNQDGLWNYSPGFRVIGYALAFPGNPELPSTNEVGGIYPQRTSGGLIVPASQQVMVADVTVCVTGNDPALAPTYQFTRIQSGYGGPPYPFYHRTSHLANNLPAGGNLGMIDGHVEWRSFTNMLPRTGTEVPVFWW